MNEASQYAVVLFAASSIKVSVKCSVANASGIQYTSDFVTFPQNGRRATWRIMSSNIFVRGDSPGCFAIATAATRRFVWQATPKSAAKKLYTLE